MEIQENEPEEIGSLRNGIATSVHDSQYRKTRACRVLREYPREHWLCLYQPHQVVLSGGARATRQTLLGVTPDPDGWQPNPSGTLSFHTNAQFWSTASQQDRRILGLIHEMTSKSRERP